MVMEFNLKITYSYSNNLYVEVKTRAPLGNDKIKEII
jgi:hypothetical protein